MVILPIHQLTRYHQLKIDWQEHAGIIDNWTTTRFKYIHPTIMNPQQCTIHRAIQKLLKSRFNLMVSMDNNFISWTWLSVNFCFWLGSDNSLICLVGFHLNFFSLLQFIWRVEHKKQQRWKMHDAVPGKVFLVTTGLTSSSSKLSITASGCKHIQRHLRVPYAQYI